MKFTPPAGGRLRATALGSAAHAAGLHALLVARVTEYAIFALDPHGHILTWNSGAERLKGYTTDEILGEHFSLFYPEEDRAAGKPGRLLKLATTLGHIEDEGWRIRKDGSRFWANVLITALRDDNGDLIGFAKMTRDLTQQREATEALRRSEERFRLLVQSVQEYAIFMLDPTGHIATWNEGARRIKGYAAGEIIGKHFSVFYPEANVANGKPPRELVIAAETGEYKEEGWRVRKDGSLFWARVVITAVRDEQDKLTGFAKVTRDLTEQHAALERMLADTRRIAEEAAARAAAEAHSEDLRALADRLRASAAELETRSANAEAVSRAKGEFLAAMSHELRTPLNAIAGYAELLQLGVSGPVTPQQVQHLERIQRSQAHLLGVINDILDFSRIEAGHIAYNCEPLSFPAIVDAVIPMIAPQARAKGVELRIPRKAHDVNALGDRLKVEQILLNLLSNAVKATGCGGEIELTSGQDGDWAWIRVRDSGVGIPEDQLEAIFEPFVQVERRLSRPQEGTGLGLSISRQLARGMKGDLVASSRAAVGSVLTLTLPLAPPNADVSTPTR